MRVVKERAIFMINVKLITGRTIAQGVNIENKPSQAYKDAASCCDLNPEDLQELGIREGERVRVETEYGSVVVTARENKGNPRGIIFIPMGPWANALTNPDTYGCGMPGFKGIPARVEATQEEIPGIPELMARCK